MPHLFVKSNGSVVEVDRFVQAPLLANSKVWNRGAVPESIETGADVQVWVEEDGCHGPHSDPNHASYDLHLFGEHHEQFMRRQYRCGRG